MYLSGGRLPAPKAPIRGTINSDKNTLLFVEMAHTPLKPFTPRPSRLHQTLLWFLVGAFLSGCSVPTATTFPTTRLPDTPLPPPGLTLGPTFTALPSATPEPTATSLPTPTPTPLPHPMSIEALRQRDYPGSEITLERELERGSNYRRFYASYLSEGLRIYALLTIPDGPRPESGWPALVFNHGYIPPTQYRTTERYINYVGRLAESGYVVFRIDYRGHDRSEGEPSGAYSSTGYTVDVLNAFASLQQFSEVDSQRIGMWGHSMGGYLTLRAMVINPEIKAGVIWAGVVVSYPDLLRLWRRSAGFTPTPNATSWRTAWSDLYGSPEDNPEFWNSISSNTYLADLGGPIQLHHGTSDASVPVEFSEILHGEIEAAGKTSELYIYEDDDHNLRDFFSTAMNRTIAFFDGYLK
jgi:uncharacterized protein